MTGTKETDRMISVGFTYPTKQHYALIRIQSVGNKKQYRITIMNGDLEKLLYGHHMIKEENGVLQEDDNEITDPEIAALKRSIRISLSAYLQTDPEGITAAN